MMLIDADALKKLIADNVYLVSDCINSRDYGMFWTGGIEKAIDEMPTVEERKVGKWIVSENPEEGWKNLRCPFCGKTMSYYIHTYARPNFCINCGARME